MKVYGINDGKFTEFVKTPFKVDHEEAILEDWMEKNPDGIIEDDKILIIGRQVVTNFGGFIDLLGLDRKGDIVVIELKRDRTPRDTIAQSLEYVSFAVKLDSSQIESILRSYLNDESLNLAEYHREYFELSDSEAVSFNKDQHIVIVGQNITPQIKQTAIFLSSRGIKVTCVEFTFFQTNNGTRLLSQEIIVGMESHKVKEISSGSLPVITEKAFLSSVDENGKPIFSSIIKLAKEKSMPIHWGTKGFSLNVDFEGTHVAICFVYPPDSVYKQTIRTTLHDRGGVDKKTSVPENIIEQLKNQAEKIGIFTPAGRDLKCHIKRKLTDNEINEIINWCESVEREGKKYGLKE